MDLVSKIIANNLDREERIFSRFACKNSSGIRKYPQREKIADHENIRPAFFHDTDKIIHSLAYSRYIDKTQVFYLFENDHITHRVLHVQFVSKIGRVIGRCLRLNEDLIEAISLGHDLGHVPYGHDGEAILNQLCRENNIGCFCHNAQSVRFFKELEQQGQGLNLTLQTLDGILAHNGEILSEIYRPAYGKTWAEFEREYEHCLKEQEFNKKIFPMTLEGCVVRISDVISYIGRDIEDAIILDLIKREDLPAQITRVLGNSNDKIINTLVLNLISNSYEKDYLAFSPDIFRALKDLMAFNYERIYLNPVIKTQGEKIKNIFNLLYNIYIHEISINNENSAFHHFFVASMKGDYLENTPKERMVIDFLAGMTDDFFNNQFKKYFVPQSFGYSLK